MNLLHELAPFALSLALGLMLGLERERRPDARVGLRSFALIALAGTALALLGQMLESALPVVAGLLLVAAVLAVVRRDATPPDPDAVTLVAALLCYAIGALAFFGHRQLLVVLAFAVTSILYFKTELHGISHRLSRQDLLSFLQFTLISCIILPVLPDQGMGPYGALNPFRLWMMVVLISGLSLIGYALLRIAGPGRGLTALSLLGGVVSSTATTLIYARKLRQSEVSQPVALFVILAANMMVPLRLGVLCAVMGPALLPPLLPVLLLGWLGGAVLVWRAWRALPRVASELAPDMTNPAELRAALTFALIFALVLVTGAWLHDLAGDSGVYVVAAVAGLTDVDAVALSALQMFEQHSLATEPVIRSLILAYMMNLVFKAGIAGVAGSPGLLAQVTRGFAGVAAGLALGLLL